MAISSSTRNKVIMRAEELYDTYGLSPLLKQHMYYVAAVADILTENWNNPEIPLDKELIMQASLTHDMGNMVKFSFKRFGHTLSEGTEQWYKDSQDLHKHLHTLNGSSKEDDYANIVIAGQLGASDELFDLIQNWSWENFTPEEMQPDSINFNSMTAGDIVGLYTRVVASYCDSRAAPYGVVSLSERAEDLVERYPDSADSIKAKTDKIARWEQYILENTSLTSLDFAKEEIERRVERIKTYELEVMLPELTIREMLEDIHR